MNIRRLLGLPSKPDEALIDWMRDPGDPRTLLRYRCQGRARRGLTTYR